MAIQFIGIKREYDVMFAGFLSHSVHAHLRQLAVLTLVLCFLPVAPPAYALCGLDAPSAPQTGPVAAQPASPAADRGLSRSIPGAPAPAGLNRSVAPPIAQPFAGDPRFDRNRYVWETRTAGKVRCAVISAPKDTGNGRPPGVIFLHGRPGTADGTERLLKLPQYLPEAVIAYGEGRDDFDTRNGFGWEPRFPHILQRCGRGQEDVDYISGLIARLTAAHNVDPDRIFVAGHSNGGFFTLTLTALMPERLRGAIAIGAYTSYAPNLSALNCADNYDPALPNTSNDNGRAVLAKLNEQIAGRPVDTLLIYGDRENTIARLPRTFHDDCAVFSLFNNSVEQLLIKNRSKRPSCTTDSYLKLRGRQVFEPVSGSNAAQTEIEIYRGAHSLRPIAADAAGWVAAFVRARP